MTKEEQAKLERLDDKLDALIRETARSCGATETSLENIDKRLNGMETSITLIREAQQTQGTTAAKNATNIEAIHKRCEERGRAIESLQRQLRRRDHSDEPPTASSGFMTDVTPAPIDLPLPKKDKDDGFWDWAHKRIGVLVQLLVLLGMIGAMGLWAFKTNAMIQETRAAVQQLTDAGQPQ